MTRSDLLALSPNDLAALTNRGTVKRAQREIEDGAPSCTICETEQTLVVTWSDETICTFPAGQTIRDAKCSSGSLGISRHIIRSILAYQRSAADSETNRSPERGIAAQVRETAERHPYPEPTTWDPGEICDEDLVKYFRKATITKARKAFEQGILVELTRGGKPCARFLHESCTVRFPVPGDIRYVRADCADSQLPQWAVMAVWAFREFPADRSAGLLSLQATALSTPHEQLERLSDLLVELCTDGIAGVNPTWPQRLARLEKQLRSSGLVWPAELALELLHQQEQYQAQDARFSPQETVRLTGELIARSRAIRSQNGSVPQALVRGNKSDRRTDIKASRFAGVGLGVHPGRRHTRMHAYFQDLDTGTVVAVQRVFSDPDPSSGEDPKSFQDLAAYSLGRGLSLGTAALSQMLLGSGKRTPTDELVLPRGAGQLTTHPQTFQWEQLVPPLAIERFAQARELFESLPPDWLRPRRHTEHLHVLTVAKVTEAEFDLVHQRLTATLHDAAGETVRLIHPYHRRGDQGFSELMQVLQSAGSEVRFVSGHLRFVNQELQIQPIAVVLEAEDHSRRAVSSWLGGREATRFNTDAGVPDEKVSSAATAEFLSTLKDCIADVLVTGIQQAHQRVWADLSQAAQRLGFVRLAAPIEIVAGQLVQRSNQLRWDATEAAKQIGQLCMFSRILD